MEVDVCCRYAGDCMTRPMLPFTNNARRWTEVQGVGCRFFLSVLVRCYYRKYFRHRFIIIIKRKEKKNIPAGGTQKKNRRKQVVVEYQCMVPVNQLLPIKNEVSGTFSFTCPATALPVSYRRGQTLCTALST